MVNLERLNAITNEWENVEIHEEHAENVLNNHSDRFRKPKKEAKQDKPIDPKEVKKEVKKGGK